MIAFGHTVYFDYKHQNITKGGLPPLYLKLYQHKELSFDHHIDYNQNQNRDVTLSTDRSFKENTYEQNWSFQVKDIVTFIWEKGKSTINYKLGSSGSNTLLEYWFLHTLLPIYLTIENKYEFIHAAGVEIDMCPVLFIAPSYGGKSTLTDYFIQQDHVMISDDRVALKEKGSDVFATASYPYHRPYRKMEDLGLKVAKIMTHTKKLSKIYVLEQGSSTDEVTFTRLRGMQTFKALQYNFDFTLPLNKARSFQLIGKIASSVPIYRITVPWDLERLGEVYEKICAHSHNKGNV